MTALSKMPVSTRASNTMSKKSGFLSESEEDLL